jgi:hypothetical protein
MDTSGDGRADQPLSGKMELMDRLRGTIQWIIYHHEDEGSVYLPAVDALPTDNPTQLVRLLDLFLTGEFPKELFTECTVKLDATINNTDTRPHAAPPPGRFHVVGSPTGCVPSTHPSGPQMR